MKNGIFFSIESLLHGIENPQGPIVQVLFAKKVAEHEGIFSFNRLARLTFTDPAINKAFPGGAVLDETLLVGYEGWNDAILHLFIRGGQSTLKIATGEMPGKKVTIHRQYRDAILLGKLSDKQIKEIFSYVWKNLEVIQPIPRYIDG